MLNACEFGVPQLRPRFILVAMRPDAYAHFEWPSAIGTPPTVGEALHAMMAEDGWKGAEAWARKANGVGPTLVGGSRKHGGPDLGPTRAREAWSKLGVDGRGLADAPPPADAPVDHMPRLTLPMAAAIQGFPPDWQFYGRKTASYRQIGNAFPPPVARAVGKDPHGDPACRRHPPPETSKASCMIDRAAVSRSVRRSRRRTRRGGGGAVPARPDRRPGGDGAPGHARPAVRRAAHRAVEVRPLHKTEKTYMGTLVEINLRRQFAFADGDATDYRIAGIEVDCKYSMTYGGSGPAAGGHRSPLPPDHGERQEQHLVRPRQIRVRDGPFAASPTATQRQLSAAGRARVRQLWPRHGRLAGNLFLHMDPRIRERVFSAKGKRGRQHGQARTNELFRCVQRRIIRRAEVATVAQQDDFMKRARGNGGARTGLRSEGILVLGHQDDDPLVASALGLPVPRKGEFVSARVVPALADRDNPVAVIDGRSWALARSGDPHAPAPVIPRRFTPAR